jgi:HTH-type transcriptional repressor of NAD biosynthesis genes
LRYSLPFARVSDLMFRCGLIVGKFSPLHRGHQYLIESALAQCEHVILLTYSNPELPGCEAQHREQWLRDLYPRTTRLVLNDRWLNAECPGLSMPHNDAPDDDHREFVFKLLPHELKQRIDAVFSSEHYGDGFAASLQRSIGQRQIRHVLVDQARAAVPISGTSIRGDVHAQRQWLDPVVYASFVERIAILGGESTGKSTLAVTLGGAFNTLHCPEYGRELWLQRGGELRLDDMLLIANTQVEHETALAQKAHHYLFCDTSPLTTLFYCEELFGASPSNLQSLAAREYSHVVLCTPDFPFVQDGTRRDSYFRHHQHAWYLLELSRRKIPYIEVGGAVEDRVRQVRQYLYRRP